MTPPLNSQKEKYSIANFYPRSPCGERLHIGRGCVMIHRISIHALLAESDPLQNFFIAPLALISIHALLAESDSERVQMYYNPHLFLSTLSLRRATGDHIRV